MRAPVPTRPTQERATVRSKYNRSFPDGLGEAIGDLAGGSFDAAGAALKDVGNIVNGLSGMQSAAPPALPSDGGSGNGSPSASGGWISTHSEPPRPTYTPPASGGDAVPDPPLPARSQDPHPPSSSAPEGTATSVPLSSIRPAAASQKLMSSPVPGSANNGQTADIARPSPSNTASAPAGGAGGHGKRVAPVPAPAAALVCVLGLLVLCAVVWLYRIKRRLSAVRAYAHPQPEMSPVSATTVSTGPLYVSAREAGVVEENPFRHARDVEENDPFDSRASRWSASTTRSASTISV